MTSTAQMLQKKRTAHRRLPWSDYDANRLRRLAAFWGEPDVVIVHVPRRPVSSRAARSSRASTPSQVAS